MAGWKRNKKKRKSLEIQKDKMPHVSIEEHGQKETNGNLEETTTFINHFLGENEDFVVRKLRLFGKYRAAMFYITNVVNKKMISQDILKPLLYPPAHLNREELRKDMIKILSEEVLYYSEIKIETNITKLVQAILNGETVIVIDGVQQALHIDTRDVDKRAVEEPQTEQVINGPREGFIERLGTNIGLLRYRLPTPDFCVKTLKIGRFTQSKVAICYLKGTTNEAIVDEVERRLSKIQIDAVLDVGYLEQFIEDKRFSPFPQTQMTERPDAVVGNLLEGRAAILVEGSPFAMIVPVVFNQFYQTTEDYSTRFLMGSFVRLARILALVFSLVFPSLYVSFISFNPELLPTEFAVAVAGGRAGVPYPAVVEVLILEVAMEVLREATVRLPKQIGGALSIVGVLIIGEAAVDAGLASPITIVVIALTTIGSFATPIYSASFALRMLRFPLVILAGIFGLYGVMVGIIIIFNHMLALTSFGVPYMSPVSPGNAEGMKDVVIRSPFRWMPRRPSFLKTPNDVRIDPIETRTNAYNERWEEQQGGKSSKNNNRSGSDDFN